MFGLGTVELLIVTFIGLLTLGMPIAIIVLLVLFLRQNKHEKSDTLMVAQLREENQRLRDELKAANRKTQ